MNAAPPPGMRVVVTGAAGFVGLALCRTLAEAGVEVHGVVRPQGTAWRLAALAETTQIHAVDLCSYSAVRTLLAQLRPEVVLHAATADAYADGGARSLVRDTLLTLAHVLDAACEVGHPRVVLMGSSLAYGPASQAHVEDAPLRPRSMRGVGGAASSLLAGELARSRGLPVVELRLFSVYGPWEPWQRLVPSALRAALLGEELPLTGPGLRRDFVYAGDVAEAALLAAVAPAAVGRVINIGSGIEISNEELVAAVEQVTGRRVRVAPGAFSPRSTDTSHWRADPSLARELLAWQPRRTLAEGLAATVPWIESQLKNGLP